MTTERKSPMRAWHDRIYPMRIRVVSMNVSLSSKTKTNRFPSPRSSLDRLRTRRPVVNASCDTRSCPDSTSILHVRRHLSSDHRHERLARFIHGPPRFLFRYQCDSGRVEMAGGLRLEALGEGGVVIVGEQPHVIHDDQGLMGMGLYIGTQPTP